MSGLGSRAAALDRLTGATAAQPLDVLVVGGGITGAGIALDAAARGFRTALVERADFAAGTSSKSSKLVHGGLRYLEQREFGLVREAATERELLRKLAPHLVEALPFALPVTGRQMRVKFGAGLWAYDALSSFRSLQLHKYLSADETEEMLPALPAGKVKGGFLYGDCKTDDARLVMEVLIAAVRRGAIVVNHAPAVGLDPSDDICRASIRDQISGEVLAAHARRVVVAAGVWGDEVERLTDPRADDRLRPSKGVHILFEREHLPASHAAGLIPDAEGRRMLFVIPWHDVTLVGTTDTPYEGDIDGPSVTADDRTYCLDALNKAFDLDLGDADIAGAYAGLRPLVAGKGGATADLSRRHKVYDVAPGVVGITGGKLTTWRRMAVDAVDRVAADLGASVKSTTRTIRLGSSDVSALRLALTRRAALLGVDDEGVAALIRTYGDRSMDVLDLAGERGLARPLVPGHPTIAAEPVYAARREMVIHLGDFLERRSRLALTDPGAGIDGASTVVDLLAQELNWSSERRASEIYDYRRSVESERGLPLPAALAGE